MSVSFKELSRGAESLIIIHQDIMIFPIVEKKLISQFWLGDNFDNQTIETTVSDIVSTSTKSFMDSNILDAHTSRDESIWAESLTAESAETFNEFISEIPESCNSFTSASGLFKIYCIMQCIVSVYSDFLITMR